jgi:hypothetical protein
MEKQIIKASNEHVKPMESFVEFQEKFKSIDFLNFEDSREEYYAAYVESSFQIEGGSLFVASYYIMNYKNEVLFDDYVVAKDYTHAGTKSMKLIIGMYKKMKEMYDEDKNKKFFLLITNLYKFKAIIGRIPYEETKLADLAKECKRINNSMQDNVSARYTNIKNMTLLHKRNRKYASNHYTLLEHDIQR